MVPAALRGLPPGHEPVANGVRGLLDGFHRLGDPLLPGSPGGGGQLALELAEIGRQGQVGGPLLVVVPDQLPDLDHQLGADLLLREGLQEGFRLPVLLGLAADIDLAPALGGLGLHDEGACAGGSLAQVGLREIVDHLVQLGSGFGIPAGVHQEADDPFTLSLVLLIHAAQQTGHHGPRNLAGR